MEVKNLIDKALALRESDINSAKAYIITGKTLFPQNFNIHFTAYQLEKTAWNYEEAAKNFSYIVMLFGTETELLSEIQLMVSALKVYDTIESEKKIEQELVVFYVKMFNFLKNDVQQKILHLLTSDTDDSDKIRSCENLFFILRLMKKYSESFNISIHAHRLLDKILQGIVEAPLDVKLKDLLVKDVLPLIIKEKNIEMSYDLVNRVLLVVYKHHISSFWLSNDLHHGKRHLIDDNQKQIFELLEWAGKLLSWEGGYNSTWTKDVSWQRLKQIEASCPRDTLQIFYWASFIFSIAVQDYLEYSNVKIDGIDVQYLLLEGVVDLTEEPAKVFPHDISYELPCSPENSLAFIIAFNAWDLLNLTFCKEFDQVFDVVRRTPFIQKTVMDFALYLQHYENAVTLIQSNDQMSVLEKNIRYLSLCAPNPITGKTFEYIEAVINADLPVVSGQLLKHISAPNRNLLFMPMTKQAIVQYCVRLIVGGLKTKFLSDPSRADDSMIGNLLVLLQLEYFDNIPLIENLFEIIKVKGLDYPQFPTYIINIDMIEEFMHMWRSQDVKLKLFCTQVPNSRRIGTRGADKNVKEDFKQIIKHQVLRCNDNIVELMVQFIEVEQLKLYHNIFSFGT